MKLSEKNLRRFIREASYEEERAADRRSPYASGWKVTPAPEGSVLGQYAFAPERAALWWDMPDEVNTPEEQKLYDEIYRHIDRNISVTDDAISLIIDLIKSGLYPDVFKQPEEVRLYRGMVLPRYIVDGWGVIPDDERIRKKMSRQFVTFPADMTINPRPDQLATSWTTREDLAKHFTRFKGGDFSKLYRVVMSTTPAANPEKFFDLAGFYRINNPTFRYASEKEFLGIGSIKVDSLQIAEMADPSKDAFGRPLYESKQSTISKKPRQA